MRHTASLREAHPNVRATMIRVKAHSLAALRRTSGDVRGCAAPSFGRPTASVTDSTATWRFEQP